MTSTNPLSEAFVCLISGHAGCTQEDRNGELWVTHHPVSTPPADDVREALRGRALAARASRRRAGVRYDSIQVPIDTILALTTAEVRPHGTVTNAEVEAAYAAHWGPGAGADVSLKERMRVALEAARGVKPTANPGEALTFEQYVGGTE